MRKKLGEKDYEQTHNQTPLGRRASRGNIFYVYFPLIHESKLRKIEGLKSLQLQNFGK